MYRKWLQRTHAFMVSMNCLNICSSCFWKNMKTSIPLWKSIISKYLHHQAVRCLRHAVLSLSLFLFLFLSFLCLIICHFSFSFSFSLLISCHPPFPPTTQMQNILRARFMSDLFVFISCAFLSASERIASVPCSRWQGCRAKPLCTV